MTASLGKRLAVREIAEMLLDSTREHFAAAGVDLPERQYIAPGNPDVIAWDCEQLVVSLSAIGWGHMDDVAPLSSKPGTQMSATGLRHAVFSVALMRCTPTNIARGETSPPAEDIYRAGLEMMDDAGILSQAQVVMVARLREGFAGDRSGRATAGVIQTLGPAGKLHGVEATISVGALELA